MKNILAITANLASCSIAILYKNELIELNADVNSTSHLAWLVQKILNDNSIDPQEIDGIITTSGPGSFTGIRAAQSFVKGFALSLKIPSVSVSYFDVIENEFFKNFNNQKFPILMVIKNEKKQIYYCLKISENKSKIGVSTYDISNLISENDNIYIVGDAIEEISPYLDKNLKKYTVANFKNAKHLLDFSEKLFAPDSKVETLYINASVNASLKI